MLKQDSKNSKESEVKYIKKVTPAANNGTQASNGLAAKDKTEAAEGRRPGVCIPVAGD
jgi:hypothetical protein